MAMSAEDKKEMTELFADAMAQGISKFRSQVEEEEAKKTPEPVKTPEGGNAGDKRNGFSFQGFLLGE